MKKPLTYKITYDIIVIVREVKRPRKIKLLIGDFKMNKVTIKINVNGTNANAQYEIYGEPIEEAYAYKEYETGSIELTYVEAKTVVDFLSNVKNAYAVLENIIMDEYLENYEYAEAEDAEIILMVDGQMVDCFSGDIFTTLSDKGVNRYLAVE